MSELFVELFCEELPPSFVRPALAALATGLEGLLEGVAHGEVQTWATPRRLAVAIRDVADGRPASEALVTGPPADRAWVDGAWTKAAIGFARGKGVGEEALEIVDTKRGQVVAVRVREGGDQTRDLLAAGIEGVVLGLPFRKSMEWGTGGLRFGRPLHGVSVLFAGEIVPATVGGIATGAETEGHRLAADRRFGFGSSEDWVEGLRARQVEPDLTDRAALIRGILDEVETELGCDPIEDDELFEEVLHLVEWPVKVIGTIDEDLLALPPRLLVEAMKKHQRYFPVFVGGKLTNRFVVIANNPWADLALVAEGNARVLRPRFYDARFFFEEDKRQPLDAHAAKLVKMRWIRGLGTVADKGARLGDLCERLAPAFAANASQARRAGELAKGDLFTLMVGEFPTLQGHMGRLYASASGEPDAVANAVEEHYLPRFAEDAVARSPEGVTVAVSDRIDTLVGCFGIGLKPKGGDPQGLRRAALGLVRTLIEGDFDLDLADLFRAGVETFHSRAAGVEGFEAWTKARGSESVAGDADALVAELVEFALARFAAAEVAAGATADVVDAVLAVSGSRVVDLHKKVGAIRGVAGTEEFGAIMETFKRVLNITRDTQAAAPDQAALAEPAERTLGEAIARVRASAALASDDPDYSEVLSEVLSLRAPVDQFFVDLMVNHEDPAIRAVRLGLLTQVSDLFRTVADFSRISTR